jgi:hypothetical protein
MQAAGGAVDRRLAPASGAESVDAIGVLVGGSGDPHVVNDSIPERNENLHLFESVDDEVPDLQIHRWVGNPFIGSRLLDHGLNVLQLCAERGILQHEVDEAGAGHGLGQLLDRHGSVPTVHGHRADTCEHVSL